jgi:hypothetical protein
MRPNLQQRFQFSSRKTCTHPRPFRPALTPIGSTVVRCTSSSPGRPSSRLMPSEGRLALEKRANAVRFYFPSPAAASTEDLHEDPLHAHSIHCSPLIRRAGSESLPSRYPTTSTLSNLSDSDEEHFHTRREDSTLSLLD